MKSLHEMLQSLSIKYKLMFLTSGVVFVTILLLSTVAFRMFQSVVLEKTFDVCRNLSANISNLAREELLINEIYEGTRNAVARLDTSSPEKSRVRGLLNTYVINLDGIIKAHTDATNIDNKANQSELQAYSKISKITLYDIKSEKGPVLRFAYPIFIIYRSQPLRVGTGVFEFDKKEIYGPVDEMRFWVFLISGILLISALIVTFFFSLRLSHPIEKLADAVAEIGGGNLGTQVEITTGGEIGQLAGHFNDMSLNLQQAAERQKEMEKMKVTQAAIGRELEIARGIQMAVLPLDGDIGPYSFMGYMQTADEVGGDYYDCLKIERGKKTYFWFFIGDVSGHGLQSGLTMLMAQTAIQMATELKPDAMPDENMGYVNRILYSNIMRLKERKYMTATLFRADNSGNFLMAGLHLDSLIFRAKTKKVDTIATHGMWLGIEKDIAQDIQTSRFKVNKGDTLLLYTDGITEAMNPEGELYDDERLMESFQKYGDLPLEQIKYNMLDDLLAHMNGADQRDDISFALIRKK